MQDRERVSAPTEFDAAAVAREIVDVAIDRKASDVALLDVSEITSVAEFFVLATGTSDRQIRAVAGAIEDATDAAGIRLLRQEGMPADGWVLLDYGQVIVHIFGPDERAYYELEHRWREASTLLRVQ